MFPLLFHSTVMRKRESITFPYDFDPTGLSSFPAGWTGSSTFVISSNVITNTPDTGAELLADPGLEGTYTDGLVAELTATGGTTTEVTTGVHGGSKAQGWEPSGAQTLLQAKTPLAKQWYKASGWLKRTAGSASNIYAVLYQTMTAYSRMLSSANYVQLGGVVYTDNTVTLTAQYAVAADTGDTIVLDDISLKQLTKTSLLKVVNGAAGYTAKIKATWDSNNIVGVVSHSDGTLDNCLLAYYVVPSSNAYTYCVLDQFVDGVRTNLVATWSNSPGSGSGGAPTSDQWLEIRYTDTNKVTLFHNDIAVGAEQSIPAELQANTYYGIMDTGGSNNVNRFFCG